MTVLLATDTERMGSVTLGYDVGCIFNSNLTNGCIKVADAAAGSASEAIICSIAVSSIAFN